MKVKQRKKSCDSWHNKQDHGSTTLTRKHVWPKMYFR